MPWEHAAGPLTLRWWPDSVLPGCSEIHHFCTANRPTRCPLGARHLSRRKMTQIQPPIHTLDPNSNFLNAKVLRLCIETIWVTSDVQLRKQAIISPFLVGLAELLKQTEQKRGAPLLWWSYALRTSDWTYALRTSSVVSICTGRVPVEAAADRTRAWWGANAAASFLCPGREGKWLALLTWPLYTFTRTREEHLCAWKIFSRQSKNYL